MSNKVNQSVKQSDNFCKYYRGLRGITGGVTGSLAWKEFEYHFSNDGNEDGFYKFLEPCGHRLYREGDSWTEKLDFSKDEWRTATKYILEQYNSLSAFRESEDVFKGKLYASYYERTTHLTYYFRNHELANKISKEYFENGFVNVGELDYPSMSGIPISGDSIACRESRFPDVGNPDFDIKKQKITSKDKKNINIKKILEADFLRFWEAYPKKVARATAFKAFAKAIKKTDIETILKSVSRYTVSQDSNFYANPATWLNGDQWLDEGKVETKAKPISTELKKRYSVDKMVCDAILKARGESYFLSYVENNKGQFSEVDGNLKLSIKGSFACDRLLDDCSSIIESLGYNYVVQDIID